MGDRTEVRKGVKGGRERKKNRKEGGRENEGREGGRKEKEGGMEGGGREWIQEGRQTYNFT